MRPGRNKWMVWVLGMLACWIRVSGQQAPFLSTEVQPACPSWRYPMGVKLI
jgi:hypothetical protein